MISGVYLPTIGRVTVKSHIAEPTNEQAMLQRVFFAATISAALGVGAGVLMAHIAPGDKFSWAALAVAPLWLAIEIVFEFWVALFGAYSRIARASVTAAVTLGFYAAWFLVRPL